MNRKNVLLSIIAAAEGRFITPAQLQKVAFLVGQKFGDSIPAEYYTFRKYHYGPFCADIYRDAEELRREGLILISVNSQGGWKEYAATLNGVNADKPGIPDAISEYIRDRVDWAMKLTFQELIRAVYRDYPDYRENSAFQF